MIVGGSVAVSVSVAVGVAKVVSVGVKVGVRGGGKDSEISNRLSGSKLSGFKRSAWTQQGMANFGQFTMYQVPSLFFPRTFTSSKTSISVNHLFVQSKQPTRAVVTASYP
jgi:hypothetical protein